MSLGGLRPCIRQDGPGLLSRDGPRAHSRSSYRYQVAHQIVSTRYGPGNSPRLLLASLAAPRGRGSLDNGAGKCSLYPPPPSPNCLGDLPSRGRCPVVGGLLRCSLPFQLDAGDSDLYWSCCAPFSFSFSSSSPRPLPSLVARWCSFSRGTYKHPPSSPVCVSTLRLRTCHTARRFGVQQVLPGWAIFPTDHEHTCGKPTGKRDCRELRAGKGCCTRLLHPPLIRTATTIPRILSRMLWLHPANCTPRTFFLSRALFDLI